MPFTPPTAADLTSRFPAFSGVETDIIEIALTEGAACADDSWASEADFRLARLLMAAHVLTCDGHGLTVEVEIARTGDFTLYKSGGLTLERPAPANGDDWYAKTSYGRRYLALRRCSVPAVAVIG